MFLFLSGVRAAVTLPGDTNYRVYSQKQSGSAKQGSLRVIFPVGEESSIARLFNYHSDLQQIYSQEFSWTLDQPENLIFISDRNQTPNAFAYTSPLLTNVFFRGVSTVPQNVSSTDVAFTLVVHEMAHSYQLNSQAGGPPRFLQSFLGNTFFFPILFIPIFIHSNQWMPAFFLEGNATWNESRFNMGGRLNSGEQRAILSSLAIQNKLTPSILINRSAHFPHASLSYIGGAAFYRRLEAKYGANRVNRSIFEQSNSYIVPVLLDKNFRRVFPEEDLRTAFQLTIQDLKERATGFRLSQDQASPGGSSTGEEIFEKDIPQIGPLTSSDGMVRAVVSRDLASRSWVWGIPIGRAPSSQDALQRQGSQQMDLPVGPLFKDSSGSLVSYSFANLNPGLVQFAGIKAPRHPVPGSQGIYVFERKFGHELSVQLKSSWTVPLILLDGRPWRSVDSLPRLGPDGSIFWFDQVGSQRVLRRWTKDLTTDLVSVPGFDARVVDVSSQGEIFFISATKTGSGLFSFREPSFVVRRHFSDGIVDARVLDEDLDPASRVLVSEVGALGYSLRILNLQEIQEPPTYVPQVATVKDLQDKVTADSSVMQKKLEEESQQYSPWKELRYSSMDVSYAASAESPGISLYPTFLDPLNFHQISAGYAYGPWGLQASTLQYLNTAHRLFYGVALDVYENATLEVVNNGGSQGGSGDGKWRLIEKSQVRMASVDLKLPLWKDRRFSGTVRAGAVGKSSSSRVDRSTSYVGFSMAWKESYPLNIFPYRSYSMDLYAEYSQQEGQYTNANLRGAWDLGGQSVFSIFGRQHQSDAANVRIQSYLLPWHREYFRADASSFYQNLVSRWGRMGMDFRKVFFWPLLPYKFPLGIHRWVPFVEATHNQVGGGSNGSAAFVEYRGGLGLELLMNHSVPFYFELAQSLIQGVGSQWSVQLRYKASAADSTAEKTPW